MKKISILIADDHKLIRETWSFILSSDQRFEVVAECSNGAEAIELAKTHRPDIILMDINMTPMNGVDATKEIRRYSPLSKVIGVSLHSQPSYAKKMLQNGARGYVTKNSSREEMYRAILEVYNNNRYVCDEVKNILSNQLVAEDNEPDINSLSTRELEIIGLIKKGFSSKEIGVELGITLKTVEVHRHNILKKLKLKNTASLISYISTAVVDID
jgi:DNA-binding NarL/FixJ family response regulator